MYDPTKPNTAIIVEQMRRTWDTRWCTVTDGPYPIITRKFVLNVKEVDHTDGIGTKGVYHWGFRTFRNAVLDAMAMNINDLLMCRAKPYKLQSHVILPDDDKEAISAIMTALADECVQRDIAITGGETSIHDNHEGLEISITMSGWIDRLTSNRFKAGQVLIGLASSGIHSNGFTAVRKKIVPKVEWMTPTRIYNLPDAPLVIAGIQHITGGAFTKLRSRLDHNASIYIHKKHSLKPQDCFKELYKHYDDATMYRTFNCGIGMVIGVDPQATEWILKQCGGDIIGEVMEGSGEVRIESMFSNAALEV